MEPANLALFLAAALAIAISPGPAIFYVTARTLAGGRGEGLASSFGTGLGGLVHVAAGAIYLVWLGIKTFRESGVAIDSKVEATGARRAFREGIIVEALNPKTAAFFLAFLPQFVDPSAGPVWLQFLLLGLVSVALNTAVDIVVTVLAARARSAAIARPTLLRRLRQSAGLAITGLGLSLFFVRRPATL